MIAEENIEKSMDETKIKPSWSDQMKGSFENMVDQLRMKYDDIEKREARILQIEADMKKYLEQSAMKVKFDIGGRKFHTTKDTLMRFKNTVFMSLLEGNWKPDNKGYYFFDRNPDNFNIILEYLRKGTLMVENLNQSQLSNLCEDLDFFQIPYENTNLDFPLVNDFRKQIESWLINKKIGPILYQATKDRFDAPSFHKKCDNKVHTLTVIESTGGCIFGGYTDIPWDSTQGSDGFKRSKNCFLFTLKNDFNIPPTKFGIRNESKAIFNHSSYGPTFGEFDISLYNYNNSIYTSNKANFPLSYGDSTGRGCELFTGKGAEQYFIIKDVIVFQII